MWTHTDTPYISPQVWIAPRQSPPNLSGALVHQNNPPLDLEVRQFANIKDGIEQLMEPLLLGLDILQSLVSCGV